MFLDARVKASSLPNTFLYLYHFANIFSDDIDIRVVSETTCTAATSDHCTIVALRNQTLVPCPVVVKDCSTEFYKFQGDDIGSFSEIVHNSCYFLEQTLKNVGVLIYFLSGSPKGGSRQEYCLYMVLNSR